MSSATFCDGVYFNVWTDYDSMSSYFFSVDTASENPEINDFETESLFHALACDPQHKGSILAVASDAGPDGVVFSLKRFDTASHNESHVGSFPSKDGVVWGGMDGIFSFTSDASEVWASWPRDSCPDCANAKKGGHIHIMDTSTGDIKSSSVLKKSGLLQNAGTPYYVDPDHKRGVFDFGNGGFELEWVDLKVSSDSITYEKSKEDANALWSSSVPLKTCAGVTYATPISNGEVDTLLGVNVQDGSSIVNIDLKSIVHPKLLSNFGGVACA